MTIVHCWLSAPKQTHEHNISSEQSRKENTQTQTGKHSQVAALLSTLITFITQKHDCMSTCPDSQAETCVSIGTDISSMLSQTSTEVS